VPKHIFRHNDPQHLEELLSKVDPSVPKVHTLHSVPTIALVTQQQL
jgi:5-aminolevulinate synthase